MEHNGQQIETAMKELSRALATARDPILIEDFLKSLFTQAEVDEIASRWALVKMIQEGRSQRSIAKDLGLSLCKITRGSRELKKDRSPFRRMLELVREPVQ